MDKLQEIKIQIANEHGCDTWDDLMSFAFSKAHLNPEKWYDMASRRYAIAVAEHTREKCADNASIEMVGHKRTVNKQSILKTPIELI